MRKNVNNNHAANSQKSPQSMLSVLDRAAARTRGEVLLPFPRLTTQKEIDAHRVKLQQLKGENVAAWLLIDTVTDGTRFWLNFVEHTFHQTQKRESHPESPPRMGAYLSNV